MLDRDDKVEVKKKSSWKPLNKVEGGKATKRKAFLSVDGVIVKPVGTVAEYTQSSLY